MKILFLQEYLREQHIKQQPDGTLKNVFLNTDAGNILKELIRKGLDLKRGNYYIDYAYGLIPRVLERDKFKRASKYKSPTQKEASPEFELLYQRIVKEKPDIIIPSGNLGCKALLNKSSISKTRGVPQKVTIKATVSLEQANPHIHSDVLDEVTRIEELKKAREHLGNAENELDYFLEGYGGRIYTEAALQADHAKITNRIDSLEKRIAELESLNLDETFSLPEGGTNSTVVEHTCWILPMYSIEYMLVAPKIQNLVEADFGTLKKFVDRGEDAFVAKPVQYEDVTTIERVRDIFLREVKQAPITAWDLETNTLHPALTGAKPLVISICTGEETGYTIPLEHKEFTWLPGHLAEIYKLIEDFVADPNIIKVGHNIQFDIRFLRLTKNFKVFKNHRDTKVMYYLLVNQAVDSSLKLSDLAYELTDMGGYDKALEDFKVQYVEDYEAALKEKVDQMKLDYKNLCANLKADHQAKVKQAREQMKELRKGNPTYASQEEYIKLKEIADSKHVNPPKPDYPAVEAPKNPIDGTDFCYEWIPLFSMLSPYASGDVDACLRIYNQLEIRGQRPENRRIRELYTGHYTELTNYLAMIEANGVKMDIAYNDVLIDAYTIEERRLVEEMRQFPEVKQLEEEHLELYQQGLAEMAVPKAQRNEKIADLRNKYKDKLEFNPNATEDKQKVLFEYTGHRPPFNKEYLVKSVMEDNIPEEDIDWFHYKTNKTTLEYVAKEFESSKDLAELLLTHSLVKTRKQNFTTKLRALIDPEARVHGGFNPTGTETTRLSSSKPNLQQLPRKTGDINRFDYKYPIKRMFVTSFLGGALLQLDYSSLESRVLALAAMDEEMTQAFLDKNDIHKETASLVFGVPIDKVTKDMRSSAKSTTFGIAYGETPFSYYAKHGMTLKQAEQLFEDFFKNKPRIKQFIDETHEFVKANGYVECLHGFKRNLRDVYSKDNSKKNGALRQSVNTRIQGSGAFLTNTSVIYINKFIENNGFKTKVVLTVHDSIVLDCPPEEIHIMAKAARHIMENLPIDWLFIDWKGEKIRYPIEADVEIGVTYNDMVEYDADDLNTFQTVENYCKYHSTLSKIKDYSDSKVITEEKYEELVEAVKASKQQYQTAL
ncbi:putative ssDNA binding domain protein [Bacillus phage vB_BspM_MarvelLand]|nr:putative ssDNA binding domain protein [Bacillus phage vB_BspM_MarvelLand]